MALKEPPFWVWFVAMAVVVVTAVAAVELRRRDLTRKNYGWRVEYCTDICEQRAQTFSRVRKQKIGFGSFEWRCFCGSGYWQPIP